MNNLDTPKVNSLDKQIFMFLMVGGFTFVLDYLLMLFLIEFFQVNYLVSTGLGFIFGSIINYYLSLMYVFESGKYKKKKTEFIIFMVFTIIGLGLNHLIMYSGSSLLMIDYKLVKIISLIIVTAFNFLTKKIFVFLR